MAEVLSLTQFKKKNPLKNGSTEKKYITELFKPFNTAKEGVMPGKGEKGGTVNITKVNAFRAGDSVSSTGIYKIKLGIDLYKRVRTKVTGSTGRPKKGQQEVKAVSITTSDTIEFEEVDVNDKLYLYFFNGNGKGREVRLEHTESKWKDPAGKSVPISTNQQERITMKIIEEVASGNSPRWTTFEQMYKTKKSGLQAIHSNLTNVDEEWWNHFVLQFNDVKKTLNSHGLVQKYNTFSQDAKGEGFMKFISELVTTGEGASDLFKSPKNALGSSKYTQKDSWNPADIWLIRKQVSGKRFDDPTSLGTDKLAFKQAIMRSKDIVEVNQHLVRAFDQKIIVGISLKKSNQKKLNFELVNLKGSVDEDIISAVKFTGVKFNPTFIEATRTFKSRTSTVYFEQGGKKFQIDFRSNQGGLDDITYDCLEDKSSAGLGKIPKDRLKQYVNDFTSYKDYPHKDDYNSGFGTLKAWQDKVDKINASGILNTPAGGDARAGLQGDSEDWKNFAKNMKESWRQGTGANIKYTNKGKQNIVMMQMFDFLHILALVYGTNGANNKKKKAIGKKGFITFIRDLFYFAQKKGMKWHFGPFGKLY